MYAVIRTGGKQYRVAPGDVIRVEKIAESARDKDRVEFGEVLVVSPEDGQVGRPQSEARVTGRVVGEGRGDKILVFHYKRKKQYKKLAGHRQPFTAVRITEITFDGQRFTAPEEPEKTAKPKKAKPAAEADVETPAAEQEAPKVKAQAGGAAKKARKSTAKSGGAKSKGTSPRKKK